MGPRRPRARGRRLLHSGHSKTKVNENQQDPCLSGRLNSLQRFTQLPFALAEALIFLRAALRLVQGLVQGLGPARPRA